MVGTPGVKQVRALAKQNIVKAQNIQKQQYDKRVKESKTITGELVMLKVDPMFKLDRQF